MRKKMMRDDSFRATFIVITLCTVALSLMPRWALGQTDFELSDRNTDQHISREEYRDRMIEVFFSADQNSDGFLVQSELLDTKREAFVIADRDGDGRLSLREFLNYRSLDFDRADKNRDGRLERDEI